MEDFPCPRRARRLGWVFLTYPQQFKLINKLMRLNTVDIGQRRRALSPLILLSVQTVGVLLGNARGSRSSPGVCIFGLGHGQERRSLLAHDHRVTR